MPPRPLYITTFGVHVFLSTFLLVAAGCSSRQSAYDVIVDLRTDLVPSEEFDEVQIFVTQTDASTDGRRFAVPVGDNTFLPSGRLAEISELPAGDYRLDLQLRDSRRERIVAERPVLLSATKNTAVSVPIDRSCSAAACPPADDPETAEDESERIACLGGFCINPRCTLETPEFCGDLALCSSENDCVPQAACAMGECGALGVCWYPPKPPGDPDACQEAATWCHPENACVASQAGCTGAACETANGGSCDVNADCANVCINSSCASLSREGGDCDEEADCEDGLICDGSFCDSPGFGITSPAPDQTLLFEMPEYTWRAEEGSTGYLVEVARDSGITDLVTSTTVTGTSWTPDTDHMGAEFWVRVTAQPSAVSDTHRYVVRGFSPTPDQTSATICEGRSGIAYQIAYLNGRLYHGRSRAGSGVCEYDATTLNYLSERWAVGGDFRSYGVAADKSGNRLFAAFYPITAFCGDTLDRFLEVSDPSSVASTSYYATKMEQVNTIAFNGTNLYLNHSSSQSCYDTTYSCGGGTCSNGVSAFMVFNPNSRSDLNHSATTSQPGAAADANRVYRAQSSGFDVTDSNGNDLFYVAVGRGPMRGVVLYNAPGGRRFLILTQMNGFVDIVELTADPITSSSDVVRLNGMELGDNYWQGDHDGSGHFYWPAQSSRTIRQHTLKP